jgi:levanase
VGRNGDRTVVGYDAMTHQVYVDRFHSGNVGFNSNFPGRYTAPFEPDSSGNVTLQVLVDWSSVEVFAGGGQTVLTASVYPAATSNDVEAFANGGAATLNSVTIWPVRSIWKH